MTVDEHDDCIGTSHERAKVVIIVVDDIAIFSCHLLIKIPDSLPALLATPWR
jgi:hypothetical protein